MRSALMTAMIIIGASAISCEGEFANHAISDPETKHHSGLETTHRPAIVSSPTPHRSDLQVSRHNKHGMILTLANRGDPPAGFDPFRTSSIALHHVGGAIFGPGNLVMRCRQNTDMVCPYLATGWSTDSGFTKWTFTIRNGVSWHDGPTLTAEDIKWWLELGYFGEVDGESIRTPAYFRNEIGQISKIEVINPDQLQVSFSHRNPTFLGALANPRIKIAHPRHLMEKPIKAGNQQIRPVDLRVPGLGPFKLVEYSHGSLIRTQRYDGYWETNEDGPLPYLDGIDYVIIPDPLSMDIAFRGGQLDGGARGQGHYLTVDRQLPYIRQLGDRVAFAKMDGGTFRLAFNVLKNGPWQNRKVRRAISLWIDREAAIPQALGGFGWTVPNLGAPDVPIPIGRALFINWPKFDIEPLSERREQAKRLLAESGHDRGFKMGHLCRSIYSISCEFLKAQLAGLGIDLVLHMIEEGQWNQVRSSAKYDTQQGRLTPSPIPEATESVYGNYSANPDSYAKHEDPNVHNLYMQLRDTLTDPQRILVWREIEKYLFVDQSYVIPIAESVNVIPYRSYVNGLAIPFEDGHTNTDFSTVWIEKQNR